MFYSNPVIKGFYPDPSVCFANGKYYLVSSSFQYFPGVPLFESDDLVNWKQIGHVLTRKNQVMLEKINSSGGVFAPTIRYHNGRFYMVTTNDTTHTNFYVYTDDIYGEWSDPIEVAQGGIDPSLLFDDDGKVYFISNGADDEGNGGVVQCQIDIETGKKLSASKCIWKGSGGRYLESPHMYKINGMYYLMAAEGGTEYGHMITYARSESVWGEFEGYEKNPVLTNRNKAPYIIQGIGHGDLVCDQNGNWYIICLGFRQLHIWMAYHTLGRETFLIPVTFDDNGWFTAGDGTCEEGYNMEGDFIQQEKKLFTFENTNPSIDWCFLRHPHEENYKLGSDSFTLTGTDVTLDEMDSPTFVGIRQRDYNMSLSVDVKLCSGEAGITVYSCESEHYDIAIINENGVNYAVLRLNIGNIKHIQSKIPLTSDKATLVIKADNFNYNFFVKTDNEEKALGCGATKYLSSEVSGGFTGVVLGLYAVKGSAEFTTLEIKYN